MNYAASFANALRWEWFRLSHRASIWVVLSLAGAMVVGALAIAAAVQHATPLDLGMTPAGYASVGFEVVSRVGPFLGIILAAIVFGGDYGWGTFRPLVGRGQPRWQVAAVKLSAVTAALLALWVVAWVVSALVGLAAGESSAGSPGLTGATDSGWWVVVGSFAAAWLVALAYAGLSAFLCTVGRSTAFGMGVAFAILIIEVAVYPVAGLVADLALDISLAEYTRWTLHGSSNGVMGRDDGLGPWVFLPVTLGYMALFTGLTLAVTQRREVGSGNG